MVTINDSKDFETHIGLTPRAWLVKWKAGEITHTPENDALHCDAFRVLEPIKVFLDDIRTPKMIYGDEEWVLVSTVKEVIELLVEDKVSHLSLDNDLGPYEPEGHTAVKWMIDNNIWPSEEIYVHSANTVRAPQMRWDINVHFYRCAKLIKKK
jgi:hypothetical protein